MKTICLLIAGFYTCALMAIEGYQIECNTVTACILEGPSACQFKVNSSDNKMIWKYSLRLKKKEYCVEKKVGSPSDYHQTNFTDGWFLNSITTIDSHTEGDIIWNTFYRELENKTPPRGEVFITNFTSDALYKANAECKNSQEGIEDNYDKCN